MHPLTDHQRLDRYGVLTILLGTVARKASTFTGYCGMQPATFCRVAANPERKTRWHDLKSMLKYVQSSLIG
jgi:hypothetical protein